MVEMAEIVKGLSVGRLGSGPVVVRLHYSADPDKDPETVKGKKWMQSSASGYPDGGTASPGWRREMEMDPNAGSGELVLPFFEEISPLVLIDNYNPTPEDTLFGGLDVGRNNPTAHEVAALNRRGDIIFFWEFYQKNVLLDEMAKEVRTGMWYDRIESISSDPAIWDKNQYKKDGMVSLATMLQEDVPEEYRLEKIVRAQERSDMHFIQKFSMLALNKKFLEDGTQVSDPKIFISKNGCPNLIRELRNLRYQDVIGDRNNSEKIVDKNNHAWDAAKYLVLSHPELRSFVPKARPGTIGHVREQAALAEFLSESGMISEEEMANA